MDGQCVYDIPFHVLGTRGCDEEFKDKQSEKPGTYDSTDRFCSTGFVNGSEGSFVSLCKHIIVASISGS